MTDTTQYNNNSTYDYRGKTPEQITWDYVNYICPKLGIKIRTGWDNEHFDDNDFRQEDAIYFALQDIHKSLCQNEKPVKTVNGNDNEFHEIESQDKNDHIHVIDYQEDGRPNRVLI